MTLSTSGSPLRRGAFALAVAAVLSLSAGSAAAQTSYFVDPVSGNPGATGTAGDPFDTIGEALSAAASGDEILLASGTYGNATGTGLETFPLVLVSGVSVRADTGATPVIDVENSTDNAIGVPALTAPVLLEGLSVNQGSQGVFNLSGSSVDGLTIQDCTFNGFAGAGINLFLDAGDPALSLVIDGCTVAGNSAPRGISLRVGGSTQVASGGITGCTVSGAAEGIVVVARGTSTVQSGFVVGANDVSGASDTAIKLRAWGDGGNAANLATISCVVQGNTVTGASGANGLELLAEVGTAGEGGQIYSAVEFNRITGAGIGIALEAINNGSAVTEIGATFYGNRISGNGVGVAAAETSPNGASQNVFPNFGDANHGANTFASNSTVDIAVDNNVGFFPADFNFFPAGAPTTNPAWTGNIQNILSETLTGTFPGSAPATIASTLTLTAADPSVRFVDNDGDGAEQISVTVDGNAVAAADLSAGRPGGSLDILIPALAAGLYDVVVTNPGGQTGTIQVDVAVPPAVVADFAGTPTGGPAPLTVAFTDQSTGAPFSWSWDFGDGNTSTAQNPTNVYTTPGTYTVSLTATGLGGSDTKTVTDFISVSSMANFSATPLTGEAPLMVTFTDESSGTPTSWSWDFGDGGTSVDQNPSYTYDNAGTYTITLIVTDAQGSDTIVRTDYITITSKGGGGGGGCFVATAAHGDYDAPEVYELRRLRDQYLQTTGAGRAFISWYYDDGPAAAAWIAEHEWARSGARIALAAPVAVSTALNDWNPGQRFGFAVLLLGAVCALGRRRVV
jgi:PKD repeat protein